MFGPIREPRTPESALTIQSLRDLTMADWNYNREGGEVANLCDPNFFGFVPNYPPKILYYFQPKNLLQNIAKNFTPKNPST
jgi:hypothetical protein